MSVCVIGGCDPDVAGGEDCWEGLQEGEVPPNASYGVRAGMVLLLGEGGIASLRPQFSFLLGPEELWGQTHLGCVPALGSGAVPNHVKSWFPSCGTGIITSGHLSSRSPGPLSKGLGAEQSLSTWGSLFPSLPVSPPSLPGHLHTFLTNARALTGRGLA